MAATNWNPIREHAAPAFRARQCFCWLDELTATPAARTPLLELDSCHDDLDRLRRIASDASDAAGDTKSKADEFEDCRRDPESHDLIGDLDSRLHSVHSSCGYEFTVNRMSDLESTKRHAEASQRRLEASKGRFCASLQGLVSLGMPPDKALQMCKAHADKQLCKACLGLK